MAQVSPDGGACTLWYRVRQQMLPSGQGIVNCPKHRWSLSDRFSGAVPPPRSISRAYDSRREPCRPQRAGDTAIGSAPKVRPHAQVSRPRKWCWRRRYEMDKLVTRLAIDRADALLSQLSVVDQCSLLAKIQALLAPNKRRRMTARGSALRVLVLRHRNNGAGERT